MSNLIEVFVDSSCEMAQVDLNGKCVMGGNYWDFHPRCHGIYKYGEFNCYMGLAYNIALTVGNSTIKKYRYSCERNEYYREIELT